MLECHLSGHRVLSLREVYHKGAPGRDRLSRDVVLDEDPHVVERSAGGHGPMAG